jgi:hypothetical protein
VATPTRVEEGGRRQADRVVKRSIAQTRGRNGLKKLPDLPLSKPHRRNRRLQTLITRHQSGSKRLSNRGPHHGVHELPNLDNHERAVVIQ